jgi:hypothetical protein
MKTPTQLAAELTVDDLDQITIPKPNKPDIVAVRLGLLCTLYVQHPQDLAVKQALAECGDQYQTMFGEHLTLYLNPTGNGRFVRYPPGGVSLAEYVANNNTPDHSFSPGFTSGASFRDASSYSMKIWAPSRQYFPEGDTPAYFSATLPFAFLKDRPGQGAFQHLVHGWCRILKPYCGYAGLGAIQSVEGAERDRTAHDVYPIAMRFPGVEIEDAGSVARNLGSHIKGVNWLTALSDEVLAPIGGRQALLAQLDENFHIMEYEGGVLIQAGPAPELGDVNRQQIPRFYRQLAQLVRPLRMTFKPGQSFIRQPGAASGTETTNQWLARFD